MEIAVERIRTRLAQERLRGKEDLRKAETVSRKGIERNRNLQEAFPNVVIVLSLDGRIQEFNRGAEVLLGKKRPSVLGRDYVDLFVPEKGRAAVRSRLKDAFSGCSVRGFKAPVVVSDGTKMVFLWNLEALAVRQGEVVTAVAVGQDITRQHLLQEALGTLLEWAAPATGTDLFQHLVKVISSTLKVRFAFLAQLQPGEETVKLMAIWEGNGFGDLFEYHLEGTPCRLVFENSIAFFPSRVQESFPLDGWLRTHDVESYLAVPVLDPEGKPLGHLGIMDDQPLSPRLPAEGVLRALASRVSCRLQNR